MQVTGYGETGALKVGLLGILNGLFGADEEGWGPIVACFEDHDLTRIVRFVRSDDESVKRHGEIPPR